MALRAQLGDAAREPGDVDLVVIPETVADHPDLREFLTAAAPVPERVRWEIIWAYDDAPGWRLVCPVPVDGAPDTSVQIDVVFGEALPMAPEPLALAPDTVVLAAPPALALGWKLRWLESDSYPQGKDLYDAVLLAEHTTVDPAMVRDLLRPEIMHEADRFGPDSVERWSVDWDNFRLEYPHITGDDSAWKQRLITALRRSYGMD
ncbi:MULTISPECIES: nucleotidyl transferase AbiEii/AbiGii toxin family protein [Catenuloplanes]|uniref:nucleotidyl transferase AbiEii/AbiGii toxin family protein n=1 Tax=Catenuloplanes TaxID=33874 RepID=UPI00286AAC91|nr:nucleotidyl transferase AbiEii/AbiGii toxin family protein [Catenuloplanes niger]